MGELPGAAEQGLHQYPETRKSTEKLNEPILVTNFEAIRERPDIKPGLKDFEKIFDKEYRIHCYGMAKESFLYVFNRDKLDRCLTEEPNNENFFYLKQVRRFGLILRTMYNFFDVKHESSSKLQNFLIELGKYNDHYWDNPRIKAESPALHFNFDETDFPFELTNGSDFKDYIKNLLLIIKKAFKQKILPIKEFHDLRKNIRMFANLLQVAATENIDKELHWLFTSVHNIHVKLGEEHDEYIRQHMRNEINYFDTEHELATSDEKDFKTLKPYIKKVVGL